MIAALLRTADVLSDVEDDRLEAVTHALAGRRVRPRGATRWPLRAGVIPAADPPT